MKKVGLFALALAAVVSCKKEEAKFELKGTAKNVKDSTMIYLSYGKDHQDSTYVVKEAFQFSGKVEEPTSAYLLIKETNDYTSLWLDNLPITFDGVQGEFKEAKIVGSPIQKEVTDLRAQLKPLREKQEKLEASYNEGMSEEEVQKLTAEYNKLKEEEDGVFQKYITEHKDSRLSAQLLSVYVSSWGKEKAQGLFDAFSEENKNSQYGKKVAEFLKLNNEPAIGDDFVDFEMNDPKGTAHKLSDTKGDVVLLDFWASWCGPCRAENPHVVAAYNKFKDKGFNIFAVSLDQDKKAWEKAIEKDQLTWTHVSDLNESGNGNKAAIIYGVNGIPDNFLIDMKTGKVLARGLRGNQLEKKLTELLK